MTLLEITNRVEARPLIEQIDVIYRSFPPNFMLYASLKGVVGLILTIVTLFFISLTGYEVVDGHKRKAALKQLEKKDDIPSTVL